MYRTQNIKTVLDVYFTCQAKTHLKFGTTKTTEIRRLSSPKSLRRIGINRHDFWLDEVDLYRQQPYEDEGGLIVNNNGIWKHQIYHSLLYGREDILYNAYMSVEDPVSHLLDENLKSPIELHTVGILRHFYSSCKAKYQQEPLLAQSRDDVVALYDQLLWSDKLENLTTHLYKWRDLYEKYQVPMMPLMDEFWEKADKSKKSSLSARKLAYMLVEVKIDGRYYPLGNVFKSLQQTIDDYCSSRLVDMWNEHRLHPL